MSQVKIEFGYNVLRAETTLVAEGYTTHGFIDKQHKLIRIPAEVKEAIAGYRIALKR